MYALLHPRLIQELRYFMAFKRMKGILVIAEHNNGIVTPVTQRAITAAKEIGGEFTVLVAGSKCSAAAKSISTVKGLKKVLVAENKAFDGLLAENLTPLILDAQKQFAFTHIITGATSFGKAVIPRVAAKLNVPAVTEVVDIIGSDTFVRPIYAGSALMTLKIKDPVKVVTVRQTNFPPCALKENENIDSKLAVVVRAMNLNKAQIHKGGKHRMKNYLRLKQAAETLKKWQAERERGAPIQEAPIGKYDFKPATVVKKNYPKHNTPKLDEAKIVISGGRGLESAENFDMLFELAQTLNAAVGASKAAVDAAFASNDILIGQNGKIVAPDLYIAVGLSGSVQHLAGMRDSKTIVAINKDPQAPIFKIADYGLVGDLFKVIPKLTARFKVAKQRARTT